MVQAMRTQFLAMQEAQEDEEVFGGAANEECVPLEAWIPADVLCNSDMADMAELHLACAR